MISILGKISILLSVAIDFITIFLKRPNYILLFSIGSFFSIFSFLLLCIAFIASDFSIETVFFHSDKNKSILMKLASSWASYDGSMLLWASLLSVIGILVTFKMLSEKISHFYVRRQIVITCIIKASLYIFIYFCANPFITFDFTTPADGGGLNPVLQDLMLTIHPPILYIGQVGYFGIFSLACVLLSNKKQLAIVNHVTEKQDVTDQDVTDQDITDTNKIFKIIKTFSSISIAFLTAGIALGSWWAYKELSFGGFWFFDPVENISLLPWLFGLILTHFLSTKCQRKHVIWIGIMTFLVVIYSTFLIRSGILTSVHSFAASNYKAIAFLATCLIITTIPIYLLIFANQSQITNQKIGTNLFLLKKYNLILTSSFMWLLLFLLILLGTIYPIFCKIFKDTEVTVSSEYFRIIFGYITPVLLALNCIFFRSFLFKNQSNNNAQSNNNVKFKKIIRISCEFFIFITALGLSLYLNLVYTISVLPNCAIFLSLYLIGYMANYLFKSSNYFSRLLNKKESSIFLSHFGFALLVLGISLNCIMSEKFEFFGKVGDKIENESLTITLKDIKYSNQENYLRQIAHFWIEDKKSGYITVIKPENRLYKVENLMTPKVNIFSFLTHDIYGAINAVYEDQTIYAQIRRQYFMSIIWFSCILIIIGFLLRGWDDRSSRWSI